MYTREMIVVILATVAFGFGMAPRHTESQEQAALTPDGTVKHLISLPHGLMFLNEEDAKLLEGVKANPAPYVPILERVLALSDDAEIASDETRMRLVRAIDLARLIGAEQAGKVVRRFFDSIHDRFADIRATDVTRIPETGVLIIGHASSNAVMLRNHALDALADFGDAYAVDTCIRSIEAERKLMTEVVMLRYLEKVAPLCPAARPKLEKMYDSLDSPLRHNPQLLRVLEAIDEAEAEKKRDGDGKDGEQETTPDP